MTLHPALMANIAVGSRLANRRGTAQEVVEVTAVTATSFNAADDAKRMTARSTAFPIVGAPSPDVGRGWFNSVAGLALCRRSGQRVSRQCGRGAPEATLQAVLDFARLKKALSPSDERLLQTFQAPARDPAQRADGPAPTSPAGQPASRQRAADACSPVPPRSPPCTTSRSSLASTTPSPSSPPAGCRRAALLGALSNAPIAASVAALQSALRAQYAAADWLAVVQPINDPLRIAQRDALVASSCKASSPTRRHRPMTRSIRRTSCSSSS